MPEAQRIYLDNAATSWPKPEAVYTAVDDYLRNNGAPAGRGSHRWTETVAGEIARCRQLIARLVDLPDPNAVVFTNNGTQALNLAIHGLLRPGDHVVTTVAEHNSVLRPLHHWETHHQVSVTHVGCSPNGTVSLDEIREALRPETSLVAIVHASNVTGTIQPVAQVAELLDRHPAKLLVDAAQSIGHVNVSQRLLGWDLLAAPGHKGLLGPLGTGFLAIGPGMAEQLRPILHGGTGTHSDLAHQPDELPEKFEAGNLNVPGVVGLLAGLEFLANEGFDPIQARLDSLTEHLLTALTGCPGLQLVGLASSANRLGVVSLQLSGYDPQEVAAMLDCTYNIQVRAGLHCAPRMHAALGTLAHGGTTRVSLGPFNTSKDVDTLAMAFAEIGSSVSA